MVTGKEFSIHFPKVDSVEQGSEEYFLIECGDKTERVRFHDYDRIYETPGLYEYLFYERYGCNSPDVVCSLLNEHLGNGNRTINPLNVLDIGAGNGMVAEKLKELCSAEMIVGIDIIEEAAKAAERDRPGVYEDYYVADLTDLPEPVESALAKGNFNGMTIVAALGFGDIPPLAFANGYNFVDTPGWIAFNIKDEFVCDGDNTGFCQLIDKMLDDKIMQIEAKKKYRHRFSQDGTALYYQAIVARKNQDIPEDMLKEFIEE